MTTVRRVGSLATVGRGLRCRCGRCGGGKVLQGLFRLKERCPTCGYRFKRAVLLRLRQNIHSTPLGAAVKKIRYYCDVLLRA